MRAAALLLLLAASLAAGQARACGRTTDCVVGVGAYRVSAPAGWDGRAPLSAALFFHGWQQTAAGVMREDALVKAFSDLGVLFVAVDGLGKTWSFPGSPSQTRDDAAFALAVLDDVERRFPVDRERVWATGFSQGASMTWWLACSAGQRFAAFVPFAGAFWDPIQTACSGGPVEMLHVHGLADETVPMKGRAIGTRWHQGDVMKSLAVMRRTDACEAEPQASARTGIFTCRTWSSCGSGREVRLCLHDGYHELRPEWLPMAWEFVQAAAARRAARATR